MRTLINVKVQDVQPGQVVMNQGYKWLVLQNEYDVVGNTGDQPRHVLRCKSADAEEAKQLGGYAESMSLGYLVGANVCVVDVNEGMMS